MGRRGCRWPRPRRAARPGSAARVRHRSRPRPVARRRTGPGRVDAAPGRRAGVGLLGRVPPPASGSGRAARRGRPVARRPDGAGRRAGATSVRHFRLALLDRVPPLASGFDRASARPLIAPPGPGRATRRVSGSRGRRSLPVGPFPPVRVRSHRGRTGRRGAMPLPVAAPASRFSTEFGPIVPAPGPGHARPRSRHSAGGRSARPASIRFVSSRLRVSGTSRTRPAHSRPSPSTGWVSGSCCGTRRAAAPRRCRYPAT